MATLSLSSTAARFARTALPFALAACGGGQSSRSATPPPPMELSFEAVQVKRGDTTAPAATGPARMGFAQTVLLALDARHGAVAQCYEQVLQHAAESAGRMSVTLAFDPTGRVSSLAARAEGEGPLAGARACVEGALREIELAGGAPPNGLRVRRAYSFVNPPIELTIPAPLAVTPPRRARGGAAAAVTAATAAATSGAAPTEGAAAAPAPTPGASTGGPLGESEVIAVVTALGPQAQACYATVLRTTRTAAGAGTLNLVVGGDGAVTNAALVEVPPALAAVTECVATAARTLHFRGAGTGANIHYSVTFSPRDSTRPSAPASLRKSSASAG